MEMGKGKGDRPNHYQSFSALKYNPFIGPSPSQREIRNQFQFQLLARVYSLQRGISVHSNQSNKGS